MKKTSTKKFDFLALENLFVLIGLIMGIIMAFVNPPWQSNDEDRHFYKAYKFSEFEFVPKYAGAIEIPKNVVNVTQNFQGIPFMNGTKISHNKLDELEKIPINDHDKFVYSTPNTQDFNVAYIPSAIGIFIARIIKPYPMWTMWFGRIFGLLFYLLILFFTIKLTPVYKGVFFVLGLSPVALFQAASITYDTMSNACSFLTIALCLRYALVDKENLNLKNSLLILIVIILAQLAKTGYIFIPLLILIIPQNKIGNKTKLVAFLVFFALLYFFQNSTINTFLSSIHTDIVHHANGTPIMQNDYEFNTDKMISYFVHNPVEATTTALQNIVSQRDNWVGGIFGRFGYSYMLLPMPVLILQWIILFMVAFFDSNSEYKISFKQRCIILIVGAMSYMVIIFGMWFGASPVGSKMVFGLQGRYFLPAIPVLLLCIYNSEYDFKSWHKWKSIILSVYSLAILIYTVSYMNDYFYSN